MAGAAYSALRRPSTGRLCTLVVVVLLTGCGGIAEQGSDKCGGDNGGFSTIRVPNSAADAAQGTAAAVWQSSIFRDRSLPTAATPAGSDFDEGQPWAVIPSTTRLAFNRNGIEILIARARRGGLCAERFYENRGLGAGCANTGFLEDVIQLDCKHSLVWSMIPDGVRSVRLTSPTSTVAAPIGRNAFAVVLPIGPASSASGYQAQLRFADGAVGHIVSNRPDWPG